MLFPVNALPRQMNVASLFGGEGMQKNVFDLSNREGIVDEEKGNFAGSAAVCSCVSDGLGCLGGRG
jgi:hypothetical protein